MQLSHTLLRYGRQSSRGIGLTRIRLQPAIYFCLLEAVSISASQLSIRVVERNDTLNILEIYRGQSQQKPVGVCARYQLLIPRGGRSGLRDRDVRGLQSLRTFHHIELHLRAFRQRAEAAGLNRAGADEHILAPVSPDEAKAFRIVEPLDGSGLTTHSRILVKGLVTCQ